MNKELIKKYKAEFDHYLNDGSICFKTDIWFTYNESIHTDPFMLSRQDVVRHIIINDEYSTFRKALVEGKLVQVKAKGWSVTNKVWANTTHLCRPVEDYRIKPDEPKFKVGDLVRSAHNIHKVDRVLPCDAHRSNIHVTPGGAYFDTELELWKPKPGEWCWFWSSGIKFPMLRQFDGMNDSGQFLIKKESSTHNRYYSFCEPLIGTLPTHLQNQ